MSLILAFCYVSFYVLHISILKLVCVSHKIILENEKWTTGMYTTQEVALVDFLKPETWYRFRVSATNRFGTGHYSWSSVEYHTKIEGV